MAQVNKSRSRWQTLTLYALAVLLIFGLSLSPVWAQTTDDYDEQRALAFRLYRENKFTEAIPILEKLVVLTPNDRDAVLVLGLLLAGTAPNLKDAEAKKKTRLRARAYLLKAKELGSNDALMLTILDSIAPDGSSRGREFDLSKNGEAKAAMQEAEAAFASGNFEKALSFYQKALDLDPRIYEAALFSGDVYYKSDDQTKAAEWFAKAIAIDPNRETAYRYWGDSLMKQGRMSEAREKFIEAFINEPYNRLARAGLVQWGQRAGVKLAHPDIKIPVNVSAGKNGAIDIVQGVSGKDDDGSSAWLFYGLARAEWQTGKDGELSGKFKKAYPKEKTYRHSLAEEVDALDKTIQILRETKDKSKQLDLSLARLVKLHDAGLLEAYILLARPDAGIVQDYPAYFKANRDKLRRYMVEYVVKGGGE